MKKITFTFLLSMAVLCQSVAQNNTFFKTYVSGQSIMWNYAAPAGTGYLYVGTIGNKLVWAKADSTGTVTASKIYTTPASYQGRRIMGMPYQLGGLPMNVTLLPGNSLLVTCPFQSNCFDAIKLDYNGNVTWAGEYRMPIFSSLSIRDIRLASNSAGVWIVGHGNTGKVTTGFMVNIDTLGNIRKSKSIVIDTTHTANMGGMNANNGLVQDNNGNNYIFLSWQNDEAAEEGGDGHSGIIVKTDSAFNVKWAKPGPLGTITGLYLRGDTNLLALSFYSAISTNGGGYYYGLFTFDTAASKYSYAQLWDCQPGWLQMLHTHDNGTLIYGAFSCGYYYGYAQKLNASNVVEWGNYYSLYNATDMEQLNSLNEAYNGYIMTGAASLNTLYTLQEGYTVKTDSLGNGVCFSNSFTGGFTYYGPYSNPGSDTVVISALTVNDSALIISSSALVDTTYTNCYNNTVGMQNLGSQAASVRVYPNPSKGLFTLQFTDYAAQTGGSRMVVDVYNLIGEKVSSASWSSGNNSVSISLQGQPTGVYLYRITDETGKAIATGKLDKE